VQSKTLNVGVNVTNDPSKIMKTNMGSFSYQKFVKFFFDRPDCGTDKPWFFRDDFEDPTFDFSSPLCNKTLFIHYVCIAFRDIENLSRIFSERQFFFGLQYIIDWSCGGPYKYYFFSDEVPIAERLNAISLMYGIFNKVFAKVCSNDLEPSDLTEISYNRLCFMWWDMFSTEGMPQSQDLKLINQVILENLNKILVLDNVMCKKSALHGLGHLYSDYPEKVEEIIAQHDNEIPDCLRIYASHAARGDVQ
jgi:hypothetical protein